MADESIPAVRRHAAVLVTGAIGLVLALILLYSVGGLFADRERSRMIGEWSATLGTFEQILEQYPLREVNESALRIEELSAALGIDIAPRAVEDRPRPTAAAEDRHKQVKRVINDYADDQLERGDPAVDPPPSDAAEFLERHRETLDALRRQLIEDHAPSWTLDLREPYSTPLPNLIGYMHLQRLLFAEAMSRASRGDHAGALLTLEASWRLNTALEEIPLLITQLMALGSARQQLGALRHLEGVPRSWRDRIQEHDYRASTLTALQIEIWSWIRLLDPQSVEGARTSSPSPLYALARPYMSYCATDVGEDWRKRLVQLSEVESYCDRDLASSGVDLELKPASWNVLSKTIFGSLDDVPRRVARYELDREMTAKLLDLKWAREELGGRWPANLAGIEQSPTCPGDRWVFDAPQGGGVSLAFSRPVEWEGLRGIDLPLRYVANP